MGKGENMCRAVGTKEEAEHLGSKKKLNKYTCVHMNERQNVCRKKNGDCNYFDNTAHICRNEVTKLEHHGACFGFDADSAESDYFNDNALIIVSSDTQYCRSEEERKEGT